jgi:hypothetical protein
MHGCGRNLQPSDVRNVAIDWYELCCRPGYDAWLLRLTADSLSAGVSHSCVSDGKRLNTGAWMKYE